MTPSQYAGLMKNLYEIRFGLVVMIVLLLLILVALVASSWRSR